MTNQLLGFGIVIFVLLAGCDFMARAAGPRAHASYRRGLGRLERAIRGQVIRFARWAWAGYHQFIIGIVVGIVLALYFTGRLP